MPERVILPTVTVSGQVPVFGDPFSADLLPFYATDNSVEQYREWTPEELGTQAFAPPLLPEVIVTPPPVEVPLLPEVVVTAPSTLGSILRGALWFLMPQPTGPREHDELDPGDVMWRPPGGGAPPGATDPLQPPNWNDLLDWPGKPVLVPITPVNIGTPVEMPPGEEYFDVSPPQPRPRNDVFPAPVFIEVPLGNPDFADFGHGSAPTPTGAPGIDPVPIADPLRPMVPEPFYDPQLGPTGSPAPDVFSSPLPDIFGNPIGDPFATPTVPSPTRPDVGRPTEPLGPDAFFTPNIVPEPTLPEFKPETPLRSDTCRCDKKEKKKKKRKEREVCYRGTYTETRRGLSKHRLEEIPCSSSAPKSGTSSASSGRKKKLKPGQFPGLGFMGSEHLTGADLLELASHTLREFAPIVGDLLKKPKVPKPKKLKKGRKPKTRLPTVPGTVYSTPFPL